MENQSALTLVGFAASLGALLGNVLLALTIVLGVLLLLDIFGDDL